jgi:MGT family glycosyltransferase
MKVPIHFLLVTIEGGGNVPPVLGLAKRLVHAGHRVRVLSEPCMAEAVNATGSAFTPFTEVFTKTDRQEDIFKDWNSSPLSNPSMDNIIFGPSENVVRQTLNVLQSSETDILLADILLPASIIAAEAMHMPSALIFHMPEYMPGPNRPPGMLGLLPGKNMPGKLRDKLLGMAFNLSLNKYLSNINSIRTSYKLGKLNNVSDLLDKADLRLIQTVRSFDFPIEPAPVNVRYTGPVLDDPDWTGNWDNPWEENDPRPLVVVSLSSTFQNQQKAIQQAINALGGLNVRGLVTLGPAIQPQEIHAPENVVVLTSAPHSQVFPHAQLVITHAGHGTVMRALSHGLPLICLPMGRDQNDNAAKVAYHGCGIQLSPKASPDKIRQAVQTILSTPLYREHVMQLQKAILDAADQKNTIQLLEQLVRSAD